MALTSTQQNKLLTYIHAAGMESTRGHLAGNVGDRALQVHVAFNDVEDDDIDDILAQARRLWLALSDDERHALIEQHAFATLHKLRALDATIAADCPKWNALLRD